MSLIHTCELNDVNPFDYLTELRRHAEELAANPAMEPPSCPGEQPLKSLSRLCGLAEITR
jgi:hypothetical protein